MKTKLVITIEIEEDLKDTEKVYLEAFKKGQLKVSDMFNPDQIIYIIEMEGINAARSQLNIHDFINGSKSLPEPEPTKLNCIMATRGI